MASFLPSGSQGRGPLSLYCTLYTEHQILPLERFLGVDQRDKEEKPGLPPGPGGKVVESNSK
jgi:hypothetical protein